MAKTVVGLFENLGRAQTVMQDLARENFDRDRISLLAPAPQAQGRGKAAKAGATGVASPAAGLGTINLPDIGPVLGSGPIVTRLSGSGQSAGGLMGTLGAMGVPMDDARGYTESLRLGRAMIIVSANDDRAEDAAMIMSRGGALPIDHRQGMPAAGRGAQAQPATGEIREEVIQEEIQVGKREVDRGGVRVFTHISEQPVSEQVTLREERVDVERRPVDRPATEADLSRPAQEEVVIREKGEEPVIAKQARVVEEVVVSKDVKERTQNVQDTIRRKDVDVEQIPGRGAGAAQTVGAGAGGTADFARFEQDFRGHSQSAFAGRGHGYEQISPAYRYGWQLAQDRRNQGRDWPTVSNEARMDWERQNPGTWDRVEAAIHYAFDRSRGR
jgi:uncharacterized protein (TIGR02271 family)